MRRSTDAFIEGLKPALPQNDDGSPAAIGLTAEQVVADLELLGKLMQACQPKQGREMGALYRRC